MKVKVSKEFFRKLKKVLKSKLSGRNLVFKESMFGQCPFYNIQQPFLDRESVSCRL